VIFAWSLVSGPARATEDTVPLDRGWQEILISVRDFAPLGDFLTEFAGYEVIVETDVPAELLSAWNLPEGASAQSRLLRSPGKAVGWVRLIRFDGVEQDLIRPGGAPWDSGGLFSMMVRSNDADAVMAAAFERGWSVFNTPQTFNFEGLSIKNVVIRGPDGVNIAVYERLRPPVEGWDDLSGFSYPFNTMAMVDEVEPVQVFFQEVLAMSPFWQGTYIDPEPVDVNFGLPNNLATEIGRKTAILQPAPGKDRRIELMAFSGLDGADYADRAVPPNLGLLGLRFPVSDLDAWIERFEGHDAHLFTGKADYVLAPYGKVKHVSVRAPNGVMLSFFEPDQP
jgi:catechol 2,3-dioxygenase-like lactoylglutathione lyase family enzyme